MASNRDEPSHEPHHGIIFRLDVEFFLLEHLDAGVNQEGTEDVNDPVEAIDESRANEDHRQAHYQRTHHAPEEDAMLVLGRHLEIGKDQEKNEEIIYREGKLN